jgi:hypothetical protein
LGGKTGKSQKTYKCEYQMGEFMILGLESGRNGLILVKACDKN